MSKRGMQPAGYPPSIRSTPGPWRVGDAGYTVFGPKSDAVSPETIATVKRRINAPLIAAAPDLLAACKAADAAIHHIATRREVADWRPLIEALDSLHAAIAKAEGTTSYEEERAAPEGDR